MTKKCVNPWADPDLKDAVDRAGVSASPRFEINVEL
jgi:hypothetical protein